MSRLEYTRLKRAAVLDTCCSADLASTSGTCCVGGGCGATAAAAHSSGSTASTPWRPTTARPGSRAPSAGLVRRQGRRRTGHLARQIVEGYAPLKSTLRQVMYRIASEGVLPHTPPMCCRLSSQLAKAR
ncbi:hypothetical protein ACR6C2_04485 [Streptomyces sp. INA 01156]